MRKLPAQRVADLG
jgi:hypothetical protein